MVLLAASFGEAWGARRASDPIFVATICSGFFIGGAMLSAGVWRDAWRPTLRIAFEALARDQRMQAAVPNARIRDEDGAFATVTGVLRSDAAIGPTGVLVAIDVDSIETTTGGVQIVSGGVQATVVGSLAAASVDQWRAGRRVRLPIQLRRPSRYMNPGVPDFERALAQRGTSLIGTVKSGTLVEVIRHGSLLDEWAANIRAFSRQSIFEAMRPWSEQSAAIVAAIVIGDRTGLD